ncbi:MAG: hypothetical protein U1F43_30895 [Myxococcota bacterium]
MIHGFLESGDLWMPFEQRFAANGYCPEDLRAFDWDPLGGDEAAVLALDAYIDGVRTATGDDVVDLVAHAGGGDLAYAYLADAAHAAKVNSYVHLAGSPEDGPAGPAESPVPTANLRSPADPVVEGADIPGASNLVVGSEDHIQVASSDTAFNLVFQFLGAGKKPSTLDRADAPPGDATSPRSISGRALTYGENRPLAGWSVEAWPLVADTGMRSGTAPAATFTTAADGAWGPLAAEAGVAYELYLRGPGAADRPVHHYREPFVASSQLVDLHALPSADSLLHVLFNGVEVDADHAVVIVQTATQAVQSGRDSLTIDATALATATLAAPERATTTFVVYDDGADGRSTGEVAAFGNVFDTTLVGVDQLLPSDPARAIAIAFGARTLHVPAWPSDSDGWVMATFD